MASVPTSPDERERRQGLTLDLTERMRGLIEQWKADHPEAEGAVLHCLIETLALRTAYAALDFDELMGVALPYVASTVAMSIQNEFMQRTKSEALPKQ